MKRNNETGSQKLGLFSKITKCLFLKNKIKKKREEQKAGHTEMKVLNSLLRTLAVNTC